MDFGSEYLEQNGSPWAVVGWTHKCWGHWCHCKVTLRDVWSITATGRRGPGDPSEHQVLNMHQQYTLAAENSNGILHYGHLRSIASRLREIILSIQHWGCHTWSVVSSAGSPLQDRHGHTGRVWWRVTNMWDWSISSRRKGWESWDYSWWARDSLGVSHLQGGSREDRARFFPVVPSDRRRGKGLRLWG